MKNNKIITTIFFNVLVLLTIVFIYMLLFPKRSYIKEKLENSLDTLIEKTFEQNIVNMKIASETYFENNNQNKITLQELIDNNLSAELIDGSGHACSNASYVEKTEEKMTIYLECEDKTDTREIKLKEQEEKLLCIYQYKKELPAFYTKWSEWSDWQIEEITKSELVNVETKIEKDFVGTKTITDIKQTSENAKINTRLICPKGYEEYNSKCKQTIKLNQIKAYISHSCPEGYKINGTRCYKNENIVEATKKYFCPINRNNVEYELQGTMCQAYRVFYQDATKTETYYTCSSGYKLNGNKCYKDVQYEYDIDEYKETTYYRYQTRIKENAKYDVKWSHKDDEKLLSDEYTIVGKVTCEF